MNRERSRELKNAVTLSNFDTFKLYVNQEDVYDIR